VVLEAGERHPWSGLRKYYQALHGLDRPDGPDAALLWRWSKRCWTEPASGAVERPWPAALADLQELVDLCRRRLLVPVERSAELAALLAPEIVEEGGWLSLRDDPGVVTVWWPVGKVGDVPIPCRMTAPRGLVVFSHNGQARPARVGFASVARGAMKRAVVASMTGVRVAVVTILALNEIREDHDLAANLGQIGPYRLGLIWYMLLGVGLGLVTLAARCHWLVSAMPAVLLFLVHLPVFLGSFPPGIRLGFTAPWRSAARPPS